MKKRLQTIRLTLEDNVFRWARAEAALRGTSISGLVAELLKEHVRIDRKYETAMRRALARKPFLNSDGSYLSRDQAHDRSGHR